MSANRHRYANNTIVSILWKFEKMINMLRAPMDKGECMQKQVAHISRDGNSRNESKEMLEIKNTMED